MKNGFTFIELIIVFFVVTVGILGVFAFVQNPITQSRVAMERLTASYLAQEGVEIIRNMRDSNWVNGVDWINVNIFDDEISGCINAGNHCELDFKAPLSGHIHFNADYNDAKKLCIRSDPTDQWYKTRNCENTIYTRRVTVELDTTDPSIPVLKVSVKVEWNDRGNPYEVIVQENLYDWWP